MKTDEVQAFMEDKICLELLRTASIVKEEKS